LTNFGKQNKYIMISVRSISKKENTSKIYVVSNLSQLSSSELNNDELNYLKGTLKDDFEGKLINRLTQQIYVVKVSDKPTTQSQEKTRKAGANITKSLNEFKQKEVAVYDKTKGEEFLLPISEGIALANYQFLKYFKDAKKKTNTLESIYTQSTSISKTQLLELNAIIEATFWARDLVNEPVSFLNAEELSNQIEEMGKKGNFKVDVLDQIKLETLKMGGLLAVNKGSLDPATFTTMEWKPKNAKNKNPIVLVGKGVVYDTGGLSLKPTANSMDIMKCDMGGAAAVSCAIYAIAKAKLPIHIVGLIPATDNRPGGNAYAPGDVVTMFDGTTVEVLNTDAEGRMILADALAYAKKYKPELVIDAATLTGSAVQAIGSYGSVVMGTASDKTFNKLKESGEKTYERTVRFPFWDEYAEEIKSPIADLKNLGGASAGAITAGKFLEHFTDYPWIHIDIAGPAWANNDSGYLPKGGTGTGVRLFFDFAKNY
jgi:leucyl aminopeptidase